MSEIRVRFCPSPTGTPHVGLVRSCLFNWAYAKHTGGKFIFRIEDTDAARDSDDSYQMILEALRWLGLHWDEGIEVGGPHPPYRQSERMDIYKDVIDKLLSAGYAYKSFSTKEEIDERNKVAGRPVQMGYDGFDRALTPEQIADYEAAGREATIRIKMPDEDISFNDMIRGEVVFKAGTIPDYVIARANGAPLYTLVNPVDDALMEVNCVLRGEDLLSSTPRQVVLFRYLIELGIAKEMPKYGHLPYVMGEGNKKLSKRDPESNLFLHRENGMIPEGLINYLALLGWSLAPDRDIFTAEELIANFDPSKVLANPARFDLKKCTAINAEHIRMLDEDDFKKRLVPYLHGSVSAKFANLPLLKEIAETDPDLPKLQTYEPLVSANNWEGLTLKEREIITAAAPLIQTRIQLLGQARDMLGFLLSDSSEIAVEDDAQKQLDKIDGYQSIISTCIDAIKGIDANDWTAQALQNALQTALIDEAGLKPRDAFTPPRVAISGRRVSPPLFESMEILGKDLTIARLSALR